MGKEYRVELGQVVKDNISGFKGIAVCRCIWLHGCERIVVQPPIGKDGKLPETGCFDEPQLEIVGEGVLVEDKPATYGDNTYMPTQH